MKEVLRTRHLLARLGERDIFGWWDSEAGSEEGVYILQQLFPRTARWVAMDLAVRSARARHEALLPRIPCIHLFDLGPENEALIAHMVLERKSQELAAGDEPLPGPELVERGVQAALAACGIAPVSGEVQGRAICLGDVTRDELKDPPPLVQRLAAAYGYSRLRELVAPYFRLLE